MLTLSGGLGNQLFQLSAGLYIEKKLDRKVFYNTSNLRKTTISQVGNYTRKFEIEELIPNDQRFHTKIPIRLDLPRRIVSRVINPDITLIESGPQDNVLSKIKDNTISVRGYYQNSQIVEYVWPELLSRFSQSRNFGDLVNSKRVDRIAIHLRFGDYSEDPKTRATHGLTGPTFFAKSIKQFVNEEGASSNLLVITDDIRQAKKFTESFKTNLTFEYLSSENPLADLRAISRSSHVITSNSTFSWWGAWLAHKSHYAKVIYPRPWFADESDPDLPIYVPEWIPNNRGYFIN